jgi:dihydrodipicolinate synthase/N-acetylneuraminate lyase
MNKDKAHKVGEYIPIPKQEPVAFASHGVVNWIADKQFQHEAILYSAPQRTWVSLTDEEIDAIYELHHNQYGECESVNLGYERAIEAKLKEKNT